MKTEQEISEENLTIISLRIFPGKLEQIRQVLLKDETGKWENTSHFIRCAINNYLKNETQDKGN